MMRIDGRARVSGQVPSIDAKEGEAFIAAVGRVRAAEAKMRATTAACGQIYMMAAGAAERMKLLRERRRAGVRIAHPEIDEFALIDRLIEDKRISEEASTDIESVDAAISKLLRDYCNSPLRVTLQVGANGIASRNNEEPPRHVRPKTR